MDRMGTMPDPPASSSNGPPSSGPQVNGPPMGPRASSSSPGCTTSWKYGETSPSGISSTVRSMQSPSDGGDATE